MANAALLLCSEETTRGHLLLSYPDPEAVIAHPAPSGYQQDGLGGVLIAY